MPEEDYQRLKERIDEFSWFIPDAQTYGECYPFPATYTPTDPTDSGLDWAPHAKILYLSPALERAGWSIILAVVAHELAHIVLDHRLWTTGEEYEAQEEEAWQRIAAWGFTCEAAQHQAMERRRASHEQALIRKLSAATDMSRADEKAR